MAAPLGETLRFLARVKLKAMFMGDDALWLNLIRVGALLFVVAYGAYYGYLYDAMVDSHKVDISATQADLMLQILVLSMVVFVNYFPGYRPSGRFIRETYPINRPFRLITNTVHDLLHLFYLYTFIFIGSVWVKSAYYGTLEMLAIVIGFMGAVFTERAAKLFIEQEMRDVVHNLVLWSILPLTLVTYFWIGYWLQPEPGYRLVLSVVWTIVAWVTYVYLDAQVIQPKTRKNATARNEAKWGGMDLEQRLFLRRKSVRPLVLILPLIKLLAILYGYLMGGQIFVNPNHWSALYAGFLMLPLTPFTYVQNNLAGFFRETWMSYELMGGHHRGLAKAWWNTLWPILAYDALWTLIAMGASGILSLNYVALYAGSALLLIPIGLYGSIRQPRAIPHYLSIQNIASYKNNTSTRIILIDMSAIAVLGALYVAGWILYALPVLALLCAWFLNRMSDHYLQNRHNLYDRLFKRA